MQENKQIDGRDDLYAIIGCARNATSEQILVEYRLKVLSLHPDKIGPNVDIGAAQGRFQQLQFAKEVLTDPKKRAQYDLWLDIYPSQFSLKEWIDNQEKIQQTLHWGQQKALAQLPPLPSEQHSDFMATSTFWEPHNSPTTKAFRDYRL